MKNNVSKFNWTLLISFLSVIAVTFVICLAELSSTASIILSVIDAICAIVFSICPAMIIKSTKTKEGNDTETLYTINDTSKISA